MMVATRTRGRPLSYLDVRSARLDGEVLVEARLARVAHGAGAELVQRPRPGRGVAAEPAEGEGQPPRRHAQLHAGVGAGAVVPGRQAARLHHRHGQAARRGARAVLAVTQVLHQQHHARGAAQGAAEGALQRGAGTGRRRVAIGQHATRVALQGQEPGQRGAETDAFLEDGGKAGRIRTRMELVSVPSDMLL